MRPLKSPLPFPASIAIFALFLGGCPDKGGGTDVAPLQTAPAPLASASSSPTPATSSSAAELPKKKKRPKTREAPPPEKMAQYRKHLTAGRQLAKKSQFPEAIKELDAALAVVPGDAPALTELSFAALKAGELDKAKKAGEDALKRTTSPKLKAMAHYNLGRVAEEQKDPKAAADHYRKSIKLRPSEAVEKRLADLTKKEKTPAAAAAPEPLPCQTPVAKIEDLCACLAKPAPGETEPRTCEPVKDAKLGRADLTLLEVSADLFETNYMLVAKTDKGFAPIHILGTTYNPGAFGIFEEFTLISGAEETAGKTKILRLESQHDRHDSDMGIDEFEGATTKTVTICLPPQAEKKEWSCPLAVPVEYSYTRDRLKLEDFSPDDVTRDLMTKNLPINESWKMDLKLGDSTAEVKVGAGKPPPEATALVGTHKL